jgi:Phage integrase family/Lecithin retinol acyltransferase
MNGRFQPGSHLHVRRPPGYNHHGVYVSDDRVIQFGSGVTLRNKSETAINAVSLADFENGGTVEVVRRLHDARHTAATVLAILSVPTPTAMAIMGWSSAEMAARYQHVLDSIRKGVATKLASCSGIPLPTGVARTSSNDCWNEWPLAVKMNVPGVHARWRGGPKWQTSP